MRFAAAAAAATAVFIGCGSDDPCAGTRDLIESPLALEIVESEHTLGWGHDTCFQCHQVWAIHAETCVTVEGIDVAAIVDQIDVEDPTTCAECHGANGVPWLAEWLELQEAP